MKNLKGRIDFKDVGSRPNLQAVEKAYSKATSRVEVSDEIKALPNIQGFGTIHSLQQAA